MADKPAFGVFPQMKPRRSQQDREAAKNVPVDLARGFVSGTLGMPGDIEALARLPYELMTGKESPTILPTSGDIEKRLPFKSDTPVSRAATGLGQLGGGAYTGPLSGARAATAIPKAVVRAGKDFVQAAGQPVVNMVNPKGGLSLAKEAPQEKALLLAKQNAEKLGQSANPEVRMLQQGYEPDWYHGSTGDIIRFRSDLLGETTGAQSAKKGFFFARDPQNPPEAMLKKSNDPASIEMLKKLGIPEEEIAKLNTVSMKGHGAETASGYALIGGSREYKEAMRKASAAEKRGDWSEYEKQTQIAEDDAIGKAQYLQGLVAKYGDARDEMLDAIQKSIYNKKLPQEQAELLDQKVKQLMPYGWYNSYSNPQLDGLKKEIVNLVGENAAQTSLEKINKFQSVKNERALMERTEEGGNVMPVALRYEKPMVYDFEGKPYRDQSYSDLVDQAIAGGHDALILKNTFDPGSGPAKLVDVGVVFNPDQVRSKFAAFDPLRKTSAIAASAGLAAPDLLAEERKAKGGEVTMDKGGAAFGVFPQMKGKRSKQDREAAKTFPIDVARGFVSGALGMPGDIESLVRMLPGLDEKTILPTSEDIEKRLPLRSDSPLSKAATSLGQIGGGFYTGPLSGARAVTAIPKAIGKAGRDFVMAAGQPAVNVIKPKGGNFLTDRLGRELSYLKSPQTAGETPAQRIPRHQALLQDPTVPAESRATVQRHLDEEIKRDAIDQWVDRNLTNYIKNQMATPEDPVRLMLDKRTGEIEAKFAKDMERADRLAERAATETDPRMKGNLTRNAEQAKMAAEMERDLAMRHILPQQENILDNARFNEYHAKVNRAVEGFPEEGMAKTPAGKAWEDITDSDIGMTAKRAGDAQSAAEKVQKAKEASGALANKADEIDRIFEQRLRGMGELTEEEIETLMRQSSKRKLDVIRDPDLSDSYKSLANDLEEKSIGYNRDDLQIAQNYPWVSKLDPETRLYEFYGSESLGFDHIIDVLKQDVAAGRITPEQLNRMSVDQAVRRAAEFDQEAAKKMREAQIKATEGMPTYKEYPEGYKWIELKAAEGALPEGANIEKIGDIYYIRDDVGNVLSAGATEREAIGLLNREEREQALGAALKYEGDTMGHCVGGYCPDVMQGKSRIYSLRDAKGEPHVTIEVKPRSIKTWDDVTASVGSDEAQKLWKEFDDIGGNNMSDVGHGFDMFIKQKGIKAPEYIHQIKGKANLRPVEKYDQYTQDFVKSGNWSDVRDLGNTGLMRTDTVRKAGWDLGNFDQPYMTKQEYDDLIRSQQSSGEGMKRGGRVSISDNADGQMMDVLDKKMAGGGDADKAAFGVFPQMKPRRSKQDPEAAKDVPKDVLRGFVAGAMGAPSDIANIPSDIYSLVTGEEGYKVPYGSEHWKETLPLPPTSSVGKAAQEMGGLAGGVYTGPGAPIRVVAAIPGALRHGALEFSKASAEAAPRVYRPHTPLKPDPAVGTRYKVSDKGGLAPKKDLNIESLQGSQVKIFPWDATSRNKLVTEVSDVPLNNPVLTEGGDDYMRDLRHIKKRIAGASNLGIAKRIMDRVNEAAVENQMLGDGTGKVFGFSSRMGEGAEMASTFPTDIAMNLMKQANLTKKEVEAIDENMRNMVFDGKRGIFRDMAPFGSDEFAQQLRTGLASDKDQNIKGFSAMNMRKAFMDRMGMVENQKRLGFNLPDLSNAVLADELKGVPKGYVGNAAAELDVFGKLRPSKSSTYDTDFPGVYAGSMPNMPVELLMPQTFENIYREMKVLYPSAKPEALRNMVVGAMEKRSKGISEKIGQRNIDAVKTYQEGLANAEFDPNDIKQVYDFMLRKKLELKMAGGGAVSKAAQIDGNEFVLAAQRYGLSDDMNTLNKLVSLVNQGATVDEAARIVSQATEAKMQAGGLAKLAKRLKGTQEALPAAEREANLAKMMESSKAPMRLYHGTQKDIRKFKAPVFLSPDPAFANKFAMDDMLSSAYDAPTSAPSGANVMPVHASVERPFDYENFSHISKVAKSLDPKDRKQFKSTASSGSWKDIENFLDSIEESGFDAAHILEQGRKNIVVFNPDRVKSAIGNRGTYDTSKPDLNKAIGGLIKVKNKRKAKG
jgi:hypothetical protein